MSKLKLGGSKYFCCLEALIKRNVGVKRWGQVMTLTLTT